MKKKPTVAELVEAIAALTDKLELLESNLMFLARAGVSGASVPVQYGAENMGRLAEKVRVEDETPEPESRAAGFARRNGEVWGNGWKPPVRNQ